MAAVCAIGLSAVLLGEFQLKQLPVEVRIERVGIGEGLARRLEDEAARAGIAAARLPSFLEDTKSNWFVVRLPHPAGASDEPLVVNFSHGLVVPDRVWRLGPGGMTMPAANAPDAPDAPNASATPATPAITTPPAVQDLGSDAEALPIRTSAAGRWVFFEGSPTAATRLLARVASPGVGQPKVQVFRASDREAAVHAHLVRTVAFTATLLILACFGAAVAVGSRDWTFLIFSAWLLMSLRLVAVNSGWGLDWAARQMSPVMLGVLARITLDLYGFFTIALYRSLLRSYMGERVADALRWAQLGFFVLGMASFSLPERLFYQTFWALSAVAILGMVIHASWIAVTRRSSVACLFLLSWMLTFSGMGAEILYNSGMLARSSSMLSAETGALGGALACALALARRLRAEILARQQASRRELIASKALKRTYESMPIALFSADAFGRFHLFNPAFATMFEQVTGASAKRGASRLKELVGSARSGGLLDKALAGEEEPALIEVKRPAAPSIWLQFRVRASEGSRGATVEGSISDVSSRVEAERKLAHLVDHDSLTGALNQRGLVTAIEVALEAAARGEVSTLADLQIDRFKMVNDLHGLATGDAVLVAFFQRIRQVVGLDLPIARIGDSYKVILADLTPDEAGVVAERMLQAVSGQPFDVEGRRLEVTASVGLVSIQRTMSSRDVLSAASHASADAKVHGRNCVVQPRTADAGLEGFLEDLKLQATLRDRLESDRFFVEFQPIVDLSRPFETLSFEALIRLRDERGAVISPARFVPAAERNGQISMIDRWVLETTLQWLGSHRDLATALDHATVNLSGASLNDSRFVDEIFAIVAQYPALARKLCFEITETVALADRRATRRFADRVHSMGGLIALDDFGAGYTSFAYLKEIDADLIKIDGSFVRDLHENPHNRAITRTITTLAHEFGKRCVAEWVETPETVLVLQQLSVDFAQGFALGKPMTPERFGRVRSAGDLIEDQAILKLLGSPVADRAAAQRARATVNAIEL